MNDKFVDKKYFDKRPPLIVAGVFFLLFGLLHLWRVATGTQLVIGLTVVPMSVSILAFIIALSLAVWMFFVSGYCCCSRKYTDKSSCCMKHTDIDDKKPEM